ncbi:helix-turn-helix domain-containing protein [Sansalvadorimonas verongulae]|uniref:helix-turn-helix domain-containing protein n=1 Tax=Sansalvadorimonas verongulae TaxID=2172824 RepID=UPI0012BC27D2|nr:XRE family transcriptional regulator [Sansalvadorimonas verongulae]MTI14180.1 XRE family transcriptional regulator [Sansalvadorimonas verongulae]
MSDKIVAHTTPAGGNVFADLGFEPAEAEQLKQESERRIKSDLKIQLMSEVTHAIREQDMKQEEAARLLGVTRPRVSDVMTGKASKFTIDALVDMLQKLGKTVQLRVAV